MVVVYVPFAIQARALRIPTSIGSGQTRRKKTMKTQANPFVKVYIAASLVIIPLIAAAWFIPADFPMLLRQILLCAWGVGAILVAERLLFRSTWGEASRALGFVSPRTSAVMVAVLVSLPTWVFLPLFAWLNGVPIHLHSNWLALLSGVVLVNGIAEEVIHRGFVFGHLRREYSFAMAATLSALLFAAQHLYLSFSVGWTAGLASVLLAALLTFPLAYLFERGGNSIGGPAILHTSSNAPVIILALPPSFMTTALVPHMGVILISLYLIFALRRFPADQPQGIVGQRLQHQDPIG
jgi:membrane protease YdiL (CAAX protease family)